MFHAQSIFKEKRNLAFHWPWPVNLMTQHVEPCGGRLEIFDAMTLPRIGCVTGPAPAVKDADYNPYRYCRCTVHHQYWDTIVTKKIDIIRLFICPVFVDLWSSQGLNNNDVWQCVVHHLPEFITLHEHCILLQIFQELLIWYASGSGAVMLFLYFSPLIKEDKQSALRITTTTRISKALKE